MDVVTQRHIDVGSIDKIGLRGWFVTGKLISAVGPSLPLWTWFQISSFFMFYLSFGRIHGFYLNKKLVGAICVGVLPLNCVPFLLVHPRYMKHGIGSRLLKHIEKSIRSQGFRTLKLNAVPTSINFYLKKGYSFRKNYVPLFKILREKDVP